MTDDILAHIPLFSKLAGSDRADLLKLMKERREAPMKAVGRNTVAEKLNSCRSGKAWV